MGIKRWNILLITFLVTNIVLGQEIKLEQAISDLIQKYGGVGVSVAVVKDNSIVYTYAFGYKNREDSVPLQINDMFRIASISKTFVVTAIMQLVEKGKLSLDDDVNKFLNFKVQNPKYPEIPITIKMLMCHRSSINDSQKWDNLNIINPKQNVDYYKCYSESVPGTKFIYCNMNYNLLGAVIEIVSHKRFDKHIKKKLLKPLRIDGSFNKYDLDSSRFVNSYWYNKERDVYIPAGNVYQPFRKETKYYVLGYNTTDYAPPAGMIIRSVDLAKYMMMHMNNGVYGKNRIISKESEDIMHEVPVLNHTYALSISHYNSIIENEELLGQTGGQYGFHTAMIFHPEKKYGFVAFCNGCKSHGTDGHELNFDIIRVLYNYIIK